jgi:hypothetical protein
MSAIDLENATEFDETAITTLCSTSDNGDISSIERVLFSQFTILLTNMTEPDVISESLEEKWLGLVRLCVSIVDKILNVAYTNGCYIGRFLY